MGVTPAVYDEFQNGVRQGYAALESVVELVQREQITLIAPDAHEIFQKDALPASFDTGERETLVVAQARDCTILTNESHVKNWCRRNEIECWDLPAILRAFWRTKCLTKAQTQDLVDQVEIKDRIVFKNKERIFQE